ncbi:MAG TPA: lysophospholipid acyltransferase family protein [Clostridia bacterium]|nr:lysophospholipid acyltransferase family protein [Clostridia bacterium]
MINIIKYILRFYYKIFFNVNLTGEENLPQNTGYVICANHISQHDPPVYASSVKELFYALGKKELFNSWFTKKLFATINTIPVDRNKIDISAMKKSLRILKKEKAGLLIFPEGTRNFSENPLPVTPGVAMLAIKAKVPVVPVAIDSTYRLFSKINISIYEPIDLSEYYNENLNTEDYEKITEDIIEFIYDQLTLYKGRKSYEGNNS